MAEQSFSLGDVQLSVAALSDTGLKRAVNEDSVLVHPPVFAVADGMGGYEAGDRASAAVVDAFRSRVLPGEFGSVDAVREALVEAARSVAVVAGSTSRGAGSTVAGVVAVLHEGVPHWLVFNVGDSRVYRHVGTELEQLTVDHSLGQELIERGELLPEDLATFPSRNVITRAIGAADSSADSWLLPITSGERLLICSDGLSGEVGDDSIRAALTLGGRPWSVAETLVARANRNGGRDNISVVIVDVVSGGETVSAEFTTGEFGVVGAMEDSAVECTTRPVGGR